jgi:hypothetical protein
MNASLPSPSWIGLGRLLAQKVCATALKVAQTVLDTGGAAFDAPV